MRYELLAERFLVAVMAVALVASACGKSSTSPTAQSPASPALPNLERFLIRANEVPGFSPSGRPLTLSGARAFVADMEGTKADEQRLRDHGFQVFIHQPLEGSSPDAAGLSNVSLFTTEDGAARELQFLLGEIRKELAGKLIETFDVPGVPTATGFKSNKPENNDVVADVFWSQGRCLMTLGSEPAFVNRLRAGVRAVYERTNGQCP